jgi:hypothetical protein
MKMKKLFASLMALVLCLGLMAGCGNTDKPAGGEEAKGSVYYLNFKPEQNDAWQALAKVYTEETGVPVTVVTAASGEYETTLMAEMNKSEAPTLFQVNGPVGLENWKDFCYDLKDAEITKNLTSDAFALKDGDKVLILEGCAHHRQCDDIGTVKIPKAIRDLSGADVEFVFGRNSSKVDEFKLVVQCGSCMLTRREVLLRIEEARKAGVSVVNYGMVLAKAAGLDENRLIFPRLLKS